MKKNILPFLCVMAIALAGCSTNTTQIEQEGPDEFRVSVESDLNVFERAWLATKANVEGATEEVSAELDELGAEIEAGFENLQDDLARLAEASEEEAEEIQAEISNSLKELDQNIDEFEDRLDRAEDTEIDQNI